MKQLIFILCLCVPFSFATTIVVESLNDYINAVVYLTSLSKTDVQTCSDEAKITSTDLIKTYQQVCYARASNIYNSDFKFGCFGACVYEKRKWMVGTNINVEEVTKEICSKFGLSDVSCGLHELLLKTCIDRVKDFSNKCEMMFKLTKCMTEEQQRLEMIQIKFKIEEKNKI